ncbi:aminoglycoside phosphotransferase family protein [Kribbella sp. NBC_01505]|uniref:phosphotransferase family protein n=1 Tax=Kribbella sp. NBC_01505 TaxID=2903580 RepID=UPI0038678BB4
MSGPPDVDYRATSARPAWGSLPDALKHALEVALGTEIASVGSSVRSGFTGGFAAPAELADGRRVFIKASDDTIHSYGAYQREAEVVPQLPAEAHAPAIVTTARTDNWFAVVSEWVPGRMPGAPWTAEDFAVVTARCEALAEAMTPSPIAGLDTFLMDLESGESALLVPKQILAGDRELPQRLQPWVWRILPELSDLVELAPEALQGTAATHSDLRPDNLLIDTRGECWTVDWNWLALGPRWMDWVGLLPMAQHHGIDTGAAIRSSRLTADVPAEHLDCFVALIAAYMLKNPDKPPPPGCTPAIREHQRLYAWTFLDWLATRRGWTA